MITKGEKDKQAKEVGKNGKKKKNVVSFFHTTGWMGCMTRSVSHFVFVPDT